jgi:hypothetical protein
MDQSLSPAAEAAQHPITPPPELVTDWCGQLARENDYGPTRVYDIATQAARWGADQELEACCEWVNDDLAYDVADRLRAARRPKPPSLKEQALIALEEAAYMADDAPPQGICSDQIDVIRRALEALPE